MEVVKMTHHDVKEEKKEEKGEKVEPIKPGDPRVARRKGSLLDTCYTTSSGEPKSK
jgi:hypothetical protein